MSKYQILKDYEQILMLIEDILGPGVTNIEQLTLLGVQIFGLDYLGTFSSDKMPKYIRENNCFILNTDSSRSANKTGHWVAFYKLKGKLWYYDSFKRSASELTKLWRNKKLSCANTIDRDQSYKESSCGSRSLAWLVLMRKFGERSIDVV